MFSFFKKKADPPVTISAEPIKDDYVLVGSSNPQLPNYPSLNPTGPAGSLYPGIPNAERRHSEPHPLVRQESVTSKHNFAIEGVPFKLASNVQSQDAFTDSIRRQMDGLRRNLDNLQATERLNYDFRTERSVISEFT